MMFFVCVDQYEFANIFQQLQHFSQFVDTNSTYVRGRTLAFFMIFAPTHSPKYGGYDHSTLMYAIVRTTQCQQSLFMVTRWIYIEFVSTCHMHTYGLLKQFKISNIFQQFQQFSQFVDTHSTYARGRKLAFFMICVPPTHLSMGGCMIILR